MMKDLCTGIAVFMAWAVAATVPLPAAVWKLDSDHTSAQFSVRHMMVSNVRGEFGKVSGTVEYDGKDVRSIRAEISIDAASIDTRNAERDEHLRSGDFFDVANHPTLTFKSKRAEPRGEGRFALIGDLTIRGVTREVVLEVEGPSAQIKDPWGNIRRGASATTRIDRKDFGLTWNGVLEAGGALVGDEVTIIIDLELILSKPDGASG